MKVDLRPWAAPPGDAILAHGEIHLWSFRLDPQDDLQACRNILQAEELRRADRYLDADKADTFIAARCFLRRLLARYTKIPGSDILFSYGPQGKPCLAHERLESLAFNLSHSRDRVVVAVTKNGSVGVDLEYADPDLEFAAIARRYFSEIERQALTRASEPGKSRLFYRLWTRKEAVWKQSGLAPGPEGEPQISPAARSLVRTFSPAQNYLCSLAFEHGTTTIKRFRGQPL